MLSPTPRPPWWTSPWAMFAFALIMAMIALTIAASMGGYLQ
ncbi:hypothetical protein ACFOON_15135 [Novosphingobium piscinae]|nr:hypothetical protein [Novosphingobium piscinae]